MKKNTSKFIITLTTKLFAYLSKLNCACCNSKCSANHKNEFNIKQSAKEEDKNKQSKKRLVSSV